MSSIKKPVFQNEFSNLIEDQFVSEQIYSNSYILNSDNADRDLTPDSPQQNSDPSEQFPINLPNEIPILPLRGLVVYPQTAVPLTIGQPRSITLVDEAVSADRLIGLVSSRNPEIEHPLPEDLHSIGTAAIIHRFFRVPDGTIRLLIQGIARFRIVEFTKTEPYLQARIELLPENLENSLEVEALSRNVHDQFEHIATLLPSIPREIVNAITTIQDPLQTVYAVANFQRMELSQAQELLEINSTRDKLLKLVNILTKEGEVLELGQKIQNEAKSEIDKVQREYYLREQLKAIRKELGEVEDQQTADIDEFNRKITAAGMQSEAEKQSRLELDRLSRLPAAAAEYGVIRTYLDWLVSLPWSKSTNDNLDISHAREILNKDHFGLEDVKERIIEFLAVRKLRLERKDEFDRIERGDFIRREREGVILCFVGPPGVGKTSLGQSIARAMERNFLRISLGGMRDEAEIRGHRRTYIGAMPGRILQSIRRCESLNPVFMLDEIDKLNSDFRGDPASALLEVLDPEQNNEFRDHYLEVAYNLSQVFFIATANQIESIPSPLLDRMEIIHLTGYTDLEKKSIAKQYLIPRQLRENGLKPDEVVLEDDALSLLINAYTHEAGVRNLEREIGAVFRKVITKILDGETESTIIHSGDIKGYLGKPRFIANEEILQRTHTPGVATGLAWTPVGGEVLFVEASQMPGSKGFRITGSIGKVMEESAQAAFSYVRSRAEQFGINPAFFNDVDIHLHVPAGATPKDGPSAGATMATALISLLTAKSISPQVGMTGEISLSGQMLPVGGIKEKVIAAHRAGIKKVIMPRRNEIDLDEIPEEVKSALQFLFADTIEDVVHNAFSTSLKTHKEKKEKHGKNHVG